MLATPKISENVPETRSSPRFFALLVLKQISSISYRSAFPCLWEALGWQSLQGTSLSTAQSGGTARGHAFCAPRLAHFSAPRPGFRDKRSLVSINSYPPPNDPPSCPPCSMRTTSRYNSCLPAHQTALKKEGGNRFTVRAS